MGDLIGRACLEEMNPINYNGHNYESWVEIIDRHAQAALADATARADAFEAGNAGLVKANNALQDDYEATKHALDATRAALREIRKRAIHRRQGTSRVMECVLCGDSWNKLDPEHHTRCPLAAAPAKEG